VNHKRVISSVSRCLNPYDRAGYDAMMEVAVSDSLEYIVSNTTEAGIVYDPVCKKEDCPPSSFPAKLTQILYARFRAGKKGLAVLYCELIDNNGKELLNCVNRYIAQWQMEDAFKEWVNKDCLFCSTLVDRIVPGRIRDAKEFAGLERMNGYHDELIDVGEVFGVWDIEAPAWLEEKLPFKAAGLNCPVVSDVTPYKKRKVRILNGAHTGFVLGAYLAGYDIVRDCMNDDVVRGFMNKMLREEIIPTLPLDKKDLESFACAVQDRFNNPFINHELMSISLNSTSKWKARNMPSLLEYVKIKGQLPPCLAVSFAAYLAFYSSDIQALTDGGLICRRPKGNEYTVNDDRWILEFYYANKNDSAPELVNAVMKNQQMWGRDLTLVPGFEHSAVKALALIREKGAAAAFCSCL
jgi:tagaturonate reductase